MLYNISDILNSDTPAEDAAKTIPVNTFMLRLYLASILRASNRRGIAPVPAAILNQDNIAS